MRIVVALGGNALLQRGEKPDAGIQLAHVHTAAVALAPLARAHEMVICHGNGPQVGLLALESQTDPALSRPYPFDVLVAQTQGMIGYWLAQSLRNAGLTTPVAAVITQTVVDRADPAFTEPSKFVGSAYTHEQALGSADRYGWSIARDGEAWRQVVASPVPLRIVEQDTVDQLLGTHTVICGGGGGAPVTDDGEGHLTGVEAVVDKDLVAAMLAVAVHADRLLVLTDVPAVMRDYGTPHAVALSRVDLAQLADMTFPAGSMGPKIDACRQFVQVTGNPAAIGALTDAAAILAGTAGTTVTKIPARLNGNALPAEIRST